MAYVIEKVLNNNVIIARQEKKEVILIGRGIGFGQKKGGLIEKEQIEKMFIMKDQIEQKQYRQLVKNVDEDILKTMIQVVEIIQEQTGEILNEHIHVVLTDHLLFAIQRLNSGMLIRNPFLMETKTLYPSQFRIAGNVAKLIEQKLDVQLPEEEIGFIALHIHSAVGNREVGEIASYTDLIAQLVFFIENQLGFSIDKESIDYMRLIRHLRFTIERVMRGEEVTGPKRIKELLVTEYPNEYNLAWKLIKIMQQKLQKEVYDAEAVYLTLHLQRLKMSQEK